MTVAARNSATCAVSVMASPNRAPHAFAARIGGALDATILLHDDAVQPGILAPPGLHLDAAIGQTAGDGSREAARLAVEVPAGSHEVRQVDCLLQRHLPGEQPEERLGVVGENGRAARRAERRE